MCSGIIIGLSLLGWVGVGWSVARWGWWRFAEPTWTGASLMIDGFIYGFCGAGGLVAALISLALTQSVAL